MHTVTELRVHLNKLPRRKMKTYYIEVPLAGISGFRAILGGGSAKNSESLLNAIVATIDHHANRL